MERLKKKSKKPPKFEYDPDMMTTDQFNKLMIRTAELNNEIPILEVPTEKQPKIPQDENFKKMDVFDIRDHTRHFRGNLVTKEEYLRMMKNIEDENQARLDMEYLNQVYRPNFL